LRRDLRKVGVMIIRDITEHKLTVEAMRKSEECYRMLFTNMTDAFFLAEIIYYKNGTPCDYRFLEINPAYERHIGLKKEQLLGKTMLEVFPDASLIEIKEHEKMALSGVPTHYEVKSVGVNKRYLDVYAFSPENGKLALIIRDNTKERTVELEKAYSSLKESEKSLAEAQEMAHFGSWNRDIVTNKLYWSDEMYRIFGLKPKEFEVTYDLFLSYMHPNDRDYVDNAVKKVLNGESLDIDYRIVLADGSERVVHEKGEVIFDENNTPIRMRGTVQDITERKRAEEKLRESEEKYRNIVETANEGIFLMNAEFQITYANKRTVELMGYTQEEAIGRPIMDFICEESKPIAERSLEKRRLGINESYELKLMCKDGSPFWAFISAKPLFNKDGDFTGSLCMYTDITKRKEAEEALANIETARKKEIHHRIKNNLQVISSLLDLQAEKFKCREDIKDSEVLEAFMESQDRVISMALIHEELHRNEGLDKLNFSQYIKELADNLFITYRLGNDGTRFNKDIEENIFFDMDTSVPLGIIINELISNSLKYAFQGRNCGEIRVKLHREGNRECKIEDCNSTAYALSVSDNGVGISKDLDIEDLDSLGLQLVSSLVEQLNGELELERNNGTELTIRFTVIEKKNQTSASAQQQITE